MENCYRLCRRSRYDNNEHPLPKKKMLVVDLPLRYKRYKKPKSIIREKWMNSVKNCEEIQGKAYNSFIRI